MLSPLLLVFLIKKKNPLFLSSDLAAETRSCAGRLPSATGHVLLQIRTVPLGILTAKCQTHCTTQLQKRLSDPAVLSSLVYAVDTELYLCVCF